MALALGTAFTVGSSLVSLGSKIWEGSVRAKEDRELSALRLGELDRLLGVGESEQGWQESEAERMRTAAEEMYGAGGILGAQAGELRSQAADLDRILGFEMARLGQQHDEQAGYMRASAAASGVGGGGSVMQRASHLAGVFERERASATFLAESRKRSFLSQAGVMEREGALSYASALSNADRMGIAAEATGASLATLQAEADYLRQLFPASTSPLGHQVINAELSQPNNMAPIGEVYSGLVVSDGTIELGLGEDYGPFGPDSFLWTGG